VQGFLKAEVFEDLRRRLRLVLGVELEPELPGNVVVRDLFKNTERPAIQMSPLSRGCAHPGH
jgi:hypothetical protein